MKKLLIGICLLLSSVVFAQQNYPRDITLAWTHPVLYVDGTTIAPGDLRGTRAFCERQDGTVAVDEEVPIGVLLPGERQTHTFAGAIATPGTYTCVAFAVTVDDETSDASSPASLKYTGKPTPPTNNSVSK